MFKALYNFPIGRRLSFIVLTITTITLITVVYIALVSTTDTIRAERAAAIVDQAAAYARTVDNRFGRINSILQAINGVARTPDELTLTDVEDAIVQVMRFETGLVMRRITYYNADLGVLVFNFQDQASGRNYTLSKPDLENIAADAWFLTATSGTWYGPQLPVFQALNERILSYTQSLNLLRSREAQGILWVDVSLQTIESVLRQENESLNMVSPGSDEYVLLVSPDGRILSSYNTVNADPEALAELAELIPTGRNETLESRDLDSDEGYLSVTHYMPLTGWRMVVVLPENVLPQLPSSATASVLIISILSILLLGTTVIVFVRQSVTVPLSNLSRAAQNIGSGDMRETIEYQDQRNEIGMLARALDDMRESLRYSYDTLENRIARRTAELEIARKKAQANAEELQEVYSESLSVVSDYQLQSLLDSFSRRMKVLLKADYCGVWLLRADEVRMITHTLEYSPDGIETVSVGQGLVGRTIAQGEPIVLDSYSTWEHRLNMNYSRGLERAICAPLVSAGEPIGAVVVGRMVNGEAFTDSDLRLLELFANMVSPSVRNAQLIFELDAAREAADRANQVKTRFLASVTHELRTPLNLIINNMDFMRIGAFGDVNEEQTNRLGQTIRSAEHLLYLINDLLDVSKIEAGEMQLFIQPTDIYPVIEDALDSAMMQLDKDGKDEKIRLHVHIDEGLPMMAIDARRIRQVLHNLLSNAIKFTMEGQVDLTVKREGDAVKFAVRDTGIGIPEAEQDKLFQPFERMQNAKHLAIEGTGLGLQISQHLVKQHGGALAFTSQEGAGTTFSFSLPIHTDSAPPRIEAAAEAE